MLLVPNFHSLTTSLMGLTGPLMGLTGRFSYSPGGILGDPLTPSSISKSRSSAAALEILDLKTCARLVCLWLWVTILAMRHNDRKALQQETNIYIYIYTLTGSTG